MGLLQFFNLDLGISLWLVAFFGSGARGRAVEL